MTTSEAGPKIRFDRVTKTFDVRGGAVAGLHEVSLDIAAKEFVVVVGASGCGKTTLLNLAAGLDQPTTGRVLVNGRPVQGPNPDRGVVFQQYALFPWLTVQDNVEFGLRISGVPKQERVERAQHYLRLVGLESVGNRLPKELSGGMKQRCAIARAYAVNPSVLLMDEPFGALDALTRVQLQEELAGTWQQDRRTVLFITHDVDEAAYLATRVVIMSAGRVDRVLPVPLPFPRTDEMRMSADFAAVRNQIWAGVHRREPAAAAGSHTF